MNAGSYQNVPDAISDAARNECESFVREHVAAGKSFMVETTLRTLVSVEQARVASTAGFRTEMIFVAVRDVGENIHRAKVREAGGGRVVTEETIRAGHRATMANLVVALREFHRVTVVDNTASRGRHVLETRNGEITYAVDPRPTWLTDALAGSEFEA